MAEINAVERQFIEEAITMGKSLGRPFTIREVCASAREQGYVLYPTMDHRFRRVGQNEQGRPVYVIDESGLDRLWVSDFFSALQAFVSIQKDRAEMEVNADIECEKGGGVYYDRSRSRVQRVEEKLITRGFTLDEDARAWIRGY